MAGISDKAIKSNYAESKYRYNKGSELQNKEFSDGTGLELYDAQHRMYDPQLGRFGQIDELSQLNISHSPYVFAENNPVLFNDPTGLLSDSIHRDVLPTVTVTAKRPLDVANGQVLPPRRGWIWTHMLRGSLRTWHGYDRAGIGHDYLVDNNGYLNGKYAPISNTIDIPIVPAEEGLAALRSLKAIFNLKNWIRGRFVIYTGVKEGLLYIGKAKNGIEFRYTAAEIQKWGIEAIEGLGNLPNNATALGVEQLIIDLNGGVESLANIKDATIKEIYINTGRHWLDENLPNWETLLKFQ
jgi:RHS repeat-associated protein